MPLIIRSATLNDAGIIAAFNQSLAWESENVQLDDGIILAGVLQVLADPHKGFYTLAERDGEVVGQILITYEWSDWRNGWFWWVQSVYVQADHRRVGVFAGLFDHLKAKATTDPTVIGIRLYYDRSNQPAVATYRRLGLADTDYGMMELYPLPGRDQHIDARTRQETGDRRHETVGLRSGLMSPVSCLMSVFSIPRCHSPAGRLPFLEPWLRSRPTK